MRPNSGLAGQLQRCTHTSMYRRTFASSLRKASSQPPPAKVQAFGTPEAYVSSSTSPLFNLSFEEHLLRTRPTDVPVCFIYRNDPCIVIGRNQNHWKELNIEEMNKHGLQLVRRRSGGGAVYHDLGNTNFSFHVPRAAFDRRTHAELIARALNGSAIGLSSSSPQRECTPSTSADDYDPNHGHPEGVFVNDRNDLCVRVSIVPDARTSDGTAADWSQRKISGSAFKILTNRAYHHGTMLLSSHLANLGSSLRNLKAAGMISKGVDSVRSSVINLSDAYPDVAAAGLLRHEAFSRAVVAEFWRTYSEMGRDYLEANASADMAQNWDDAEGRDSPDVVTVDESYPLAKDPKRQALEDELASWDWIFGQCPEFEVTLNLSDASEGTRSPIRELLGVDDASVWLRSKRGLIEEVQIRDLKMSADHDGQQVRKSLQALQGQRYDIFTNKPPLPLSRVNPQEARADSPNVVAADLFDFDSVEAREALGRWLAEAL